MGPFQHTELMFDRSQCAGVPQPDSMNARRMGNKMCLAMMGIMPHPACSAKDEGKTPDRSGA